MSYVSSHIHCVFSAKERRPMIAPELRERLWAFRNQEEHHRKMSFQEEFLALLKKHRIDYDERYLWE
jgi:hypothetical protein